MMSDLMQQVEADAQSLNNLSDLSTDKLKSVAETAENIKQKEDEVAKLEEKLKQAKQDLIALTDADLPLLMEEINLESFTLSDGSKINITPTYGGTIKVSDRPKAHQWLRENGFGDLIKNAISAEFGMGEDNIAKDFYETALAKGFDVNQKETIHNMTLRSWIKEQTEKGSVIPPEFGAWTGRRAKITRSK